MVFLCPIMGIPYFDILRGYPWRTNSDHNSNHKKHQHVQEPLALLFLQFLFEKGNPEDSSLKFQFIFHHMYVTYSFGLPLTQ